jgi:glycosidase
MRPVHRWALALLLAGSAPVLEGACGSPPRRDCFARVWVAGDAADIRVRGSWDGWQKAHVPELQDSGARLLRIELPPGEHQYLLQQGEELFVDQANPLTSFREADGVEVSSLLVEDCNEPSIAIWSVAAEPDGTVRIKGQFLAATSEASLDEGSIVARTVDGERFEALEADASTGDLLLGAQGLGRGKHVLHVEAKDGDGTPAVPARVAVWVDPVAPQWSDGILYQVMIDRFRGDDGAALAPPPTPGSRAGGTLRGVLAELEAGTFDELGVSGLWLSPVYVNPTEARPGADGNAYEGYHGYWPLESRAVDERIGGDAALDALVDAAHARGMQVILDLVPNHVYDGNALYAEKRDAGWFQPEGCVCGTATCPWSEHIQDCWFTPYLPDIRWQAAGTLDHAADEARFWLERFDVDGFRVDAVPMMPRAATRRIAHHLRTTTDPRGATFLLGEVFTGPGEGALGQLGVYLGPDTLDSVFDFPLMWALRGAIADGNGGFEEVDAILAAGDEQFRGSGAVMAHMLDNHDTTRFLSVANGDDGASGWGPSPAAQPTTEEPYTRLGLGLVAILTLPGLPVIYYGDEVGLAGGGDPDSRRVMPAEDALLEPQRRVRDVARRLGKLRRCSAALRSAERTTLHVEPRVWAYARGDAAADDRVVIAMHASTGPSPAAIAGELLPAGSYVDVLGGASFEVGPGAALEVPPLTALVLVPAGSPCL